MKTLTLILLVLCSLSGYSQGIKAGQHGSSDHFFNPQPDISVVYDTLPGTKTFPFDLNGDGIIDFEIKSYWNPTSEDYAETCQIIPLNGNEIVFKNDSCFDDGSPEFGIPPRFRNIIPVCKGLEYGEEINSTSYWSDTSMYLNYSTWSNSLHYACSGTDFSNDLRFGGLRPFAGVRVFLDNDTLYGWLKISGLISENDYTRALKIEEYALESILTGIDEQFKYPITLHPNPMITKATLTLDKSTDFTFSLYNLQGQLVSQKEIHNSNTMEIHKGDLNQGIYIYNVILEDGSIANGRIVIK